MHMKSQGFTLIEIMMVVMIIGILAAIAMPSYKQYTIRNNRTAVQAEMMQVANALERYRAQQLTYKNAVIGTATTGKFSVYSSLVYPATGVTLYDLNLTVAANNISWVLTAKPVSSSVQKGNGILQLDSTGKKCWDKASDTAVTTCSSWN